jgi:DNA polymerase-3 subunit delta
MTFDQVIGDLKNGAFKPIYFLHGEEPYYIDRITDYITGHVLTEAERSFNQTIVYGKDSDAGQVTGLARRFPMMATHQVVVVKEAQDLADFDNLVHYAEHPLPSTLLVINYKYRNPDRRKKVFKALEKNGVSFESRKLYENEVPGWITGYVSGRKYRIEPKAAVLLAEFLGSDLSKIEGELDKLIIAIGEGERTITPDHVERNIGISKDFNAFELQQALGKRDALKAQRIVNYFAANDKNHPLVVTLASLYYFFSRVLMVHYTKDRSPDHLAEVLKLKSKFFAKDYLAAAGNYSATRVVKIISLLREYDMRSKGYDGYNVPDGPLLKELVFKILHL